MFGRLGILLLILCGLGYLIWVLLPETIKGSKKSQNPQDPNLPDGWKIQYNEKTKKYRWCDSNGYSSNFGFISKSEAICSAWRQYQARQERVGTWTKVPEEKL